MTAQRGRWLLLVGVLACWMVQRAVGFQAASVPSPSPSTGVITGRVVDENGQPAVGFRVQAVIRRKKWNGPYYETAVGRPDEADDRGEFRLHSLPPGQYAVAVSMPQPPPGSGPPQVVKGPEYLRTFNPGTTSLENAQPIVVA